MAWGWLKKIKWRFWARVVAKAAEDGDIGSGKKTSTAGSIAGTLLDVTEPKQGE